MDKDISIELTKYRNEDLDITFVNHKFDDIALPDNIIEQDTMTTTSKHVHGSIIQDIAGYNVTHLYEEMNHTRRYIMVKKPPVLE